MVKIDNTNETKSFSRAAETKAKTGRVFWGLQMTRRLQPMPPPFSLSLNHSEGEVDTGAQGRFALGD